MSLNLLLNINPIVIFFIAPPAYGKTSKLIELVEESRGFEQFIYVSPLRVLADEFSERLSLKFRVENIRCFKDLHFCTDVKVYVITPELINDDFLMKFKNSSTTIVLDEFHLFNEWGESFRPKMWVTLIDLLSYNFSLLLLSATIEQKLLDDFTKMLNLTSDYQVFKLDLGNYQLKHKPEYVFYYPGYLKNLMLENVEFELHKNKNVLIFCQYRNEVRALEKKFKQKWRVLTCVGGETLAFVDNLKKYKPQIIISTIVLSHGVNLPRIDAVFINYSVKQKNMLLQMAARGGRQGEPFNIHIVDKFYLKNESIFSLIIHSLKVRVLNPFYNLKFKIQPS